MNVINISGEEGKQDWKKPWYIKAGHDTSLDPPGVGDDLQCFTKHSL
jgi:hypothetical protein